MGADPIATALVLVDLQHDFLERPGLVPGADDLCERVGDLLGNVRALGLPVVHVQTSVRADGADRMPHWIANGLTACVVGTRGAAAPDALQPVDGELVTTKRFYSGFEDASLERWLRGREVDRLVVAGVYSHGCIRSTVLDAYQRGYEVWVAMDAIATTDPEHGEVSNRWLDGRAARFLGVEDIVRALRDMRR